MSSTAANGSYFFVLSIWARTARYFLLRKRAAFFLTGAAVGACSVVVASAAATIFTSSVLVIMSLVLRFAPIVSFMRLRIRQLPHPCCGQCRQHFSLLVQGFVYSSLAFFRLQSL